MSRICESQTIEGIQEARRAGCTAIVIAGKGVGVKSIVQGELLSVAAWYDNEMGYSSRLAETAARIAH